MSSSVVLSPSVAPIATVSELSSSSTLTHRTNRASYPRRAREHPSTSPGPTNASSTMSTRSRRSYSRSLSHAGGSPTKQSSPDKRSITSSGSRRDRDHKGDISYDTDQTKTAALGLEIGEDEPSDQVVFLPGEEEEGGKEVKREQDGEPEIDGQGDAVITDQSMTALTGPVVSEEPTKKNVIRLVLGRKRKAEADEAVDPSRERGKDVEENTIESEYEREIEQDREEERAEGSVHDEDRADTKDEKNGGPRRLPRKKRKWLKKGEVDPDDPVAVARQRAKHKIIDEAIESLDKQEEMLLADSHPQLLWLWAELDRRRNLQLKWLEARHEAVIGDLATMRDHEKRASKSDFRVKREALADDMVRDNRHRMARATAERTALKREEDTLPTLKTGRGGGGWVLSDKFLLSTGDQQLAPVEVRGVRRQRPDISQQIQSLSFEEIQSDLQKLGRIIPFNSPLSPPIKASVSHQSHHHNESRRATTARPEWAQHKPSPPQQQAPPPRPLSLWNPPRDIGYHLGKPSTSRPKSPELIHPQPKRERIEGNNGHHHHRFDPHPSPYDARPPHDHDYDAKLRQDRFPPPQQQMSGSRSDASRYGYWPPPLGSSAIGGQGGRMTNTASSAPYHHSYLPRPPAPPSLGLPPRA
ncbi:hypothetical protein IAR55_005467 [Kwoniella newhampshirensis]|uniref:Something about silencing protein 4 domain-containing protein n=1 Tax=Kwoniella newhampshirensis TaxID=1651941 RepID=A0AAW0YZ87_9TREE